MIVSYCPSPLRKPSEIAGLSTNPGISLKSLRAKKVKKGRVSPGMRSSRQLASRRECYVRDNR